MNLGTRISVFAIAFATSLPLQLDAQWSNGRKANAVIGQPNFESSEAGLSASRFLEPVDVVVDPDTGKVFVSDSLNNSRVLRFSSIAAMSIGAAAEAVFGQADFTSAVQATTATGMRSPRGLAFHNGTLWVADTGNHRILRFDNAATLDTGVPADGVLGQPNFTAMGSATTQSGLNAPYGITVDFFGGLWVADANNNRILRYANAAGKANGANADLVLGQSLFTTADEATTQSGMRFPTDVAIRLLLVAGPSFDIQLWVADYSNNRVLRFDAAEEKSNGGSVDGVLGQFLFTTDASFLSSTGMSLPLSLAVDGTALWISDTGFNRVLRHEGAGGKSDGASADIVLGQIYSNSLATPAVTQSSITQPAGLHADTNGNLFVVDNNVATPIRVLRFSPGFPQPDNTVGKKPKAQKGDDLYPFPAGQKIKVRAKKGRPRAKVFYRIQNDGPFDDLTKLRASKSNRKVDLQYFLKDGGRKNITARITRGKGYTHNLLYNSTVRLNVKIRFQSKAKKNLFLLSQSLENGARDKVKAKVIGNP